MEQPAPPADAEQPGPPPIMAGNVPAPLWALIGVMALIELTLSASDAGFIFKDLRLVAFSYGAFWKPVLTGDLQPLLPAQPIYMFLSHAFLHAGLLHLVMNSVIILSLGKFISDQTGPWPMIGLFAASAIGGAIIFGLISTAQGPAIGASGAAFGFLGLWQYWEYIMRRARGDSIRPVLQTILALIIMNVVLLIALGGGLAWEAHLGGFITGAAAGPLMTRIARRRAYEKMSA